MLCFHVEMGSFFVAVAVAVAVVAADVIVVDIVYDCCFVSVFACHHIVTGLIWRSTMDFLSLILCVYVYISTYMYSPKPNKFTIRKREKMEKN